METTFWETIAASGPIAIVLGFALYLVARWGLKQQKEKDQLSELRVADAKIYVEQVKQQAKECEDRVERIMIRLVENIERMADVDDR